MRQKAGRLMAFDPSRPDREAQKAPRVRRRWQTAELQKARRQRMPFDRTSMLELQATDPLATLLACSGRRHNQLFRPYHERKLGDQTRDDADKEPHEERSCGRSQALLYNNIRTHRSLDKDAPVPRPVQRTGRIKSISILGGLHHHCARV